MNIFSYDDENTVDATNSRHQKWKDMKKINFYLQVYIFFFPENLCFIDYTKGFDCVDHNKLWKMFKRREYSTTLSASWEICIQVKKQ